MDEKQKPKIDDRLTSAEASVPDKPETPEVYAIADLRQYVKPPMSEELGASGGGLVDLDTKVVCTCVPVETCVCHAVTYNPQASDCGATCSCVQDTCVCGCTGTTCYYYYRPY